VSGIPSGAPETQVRFLSARLKLANKQIEETNELRKQLQEQNSDLQKQLKVNEGL
jgi:predicted transcriptional regulator